MINKYIATAPDGTTFSRRSPRTYTHCVLLKCANGDWDRAQVARIQAGKLTANEAGDLKRLRCFYRDLSDESYRAQKLSDFAQFYLGSAAYNDLIAGKWASRGFAGSLQLAEKVAAKARKEEHATEVAVVAVTATI